MSRWSTIAIPLAVAVAFVSACSGEGSLDGVNAGKGGSMNVSQGGPQDIALFRARVDAGEVPASDTLDAVGFFAEHAVDLPPADCGHDLCVQPMLSVMPRFNGSNWTMAFVSMNTPLDPATLPRPPLHLVMVLEASPEVLFYRDALRQGLGGIAESLREGDRLSLVSFDTVAKTSMTGALPDRTAVENWVESAQAFDHGALYDGLAAADRAIQAVPFDGAHRVLLVTTGRASVGISDPERIVMLGEGLARRGTALSIVGVGEEYDAKLPAALGSLGAGSYAYAVEPQDLLDVLALAGDTTLFPLATNLRMTLTPAAGYRIGRVYGARRVWSHPGVAVLDLPALFIGRREGAMDVEGGRRGGGGGLFVELIADPSAGVPQNAPAFRVESSWDEAAGPVSESQEVLNVLAPGENPSPTEPFFSAPGFGKPFMMLNMYLALRSTVDLFEGGDCARAAGVADMMAQSVQGWQTRFYDPDIEADQDLLLRLSQNVIVACEAHGPVRPVQPLSFDGGCGFF